MSHRVFPKEEYLLKGHAACPGCGATLLLRHVLKALGPETYLVIPACCTSVIAGPHPQNSFQGSSSSYCFCCKCRCCLRNDRGS